MSSPNIHSQMAINTRVNGNTTKKMSTKHIRGLREVKTKENGLMEKDTVMEYTSGKMGTSTMENEN